MGNKENSIYQFYLNLSNLNRYNLGKHLWRNKEWKRDKSNTSKIHFEDKCVLLVCSAKFRKMRTRIYSAEWRIASKRRKRKKKKTKQKLHPRQERKHDRLVKQDVRCLRIRIVPMNRTSDSMTNL